MAMSERLQQVVSQTEELNGDDELRAFSQLAGGDPADEVPKGIPISISLPRIEPKEAKWESYKSECERSMSGYVKELQAVFGLEIRSVPLAQALGVIARPEQIRELDSRKDIEYLELNERLQVTLMDDANPNIGLPEFRANNSGATGSGVRIAVLDSGIDLTHPHLRVAYSTNKNPEPDSLPGDHGTHCAGSVASQDSVYGGVAPGVELLNIKVLDQAGSGTSIDIADGITEAVNQNADVISMSVGFNHLPTWSQGGHGWSCPNGACILCRTVDNAVALGKVVVVAAGNEHDRAEVLRRSGRGSAFDTELGCPGNARSAITVGAVTKRDPSGNFDVASFSSRGPTSYGDPKPDIAAPGVNITSTVPRPAWWPGAPPRGVLFRKMSGTSMATPIVAGTAALVIEKFSARGLHWTPADVLSELQSKAESMAASSLEVGAGVLDLRHL